MAKTTKLLAKAAKPKVKAKAVTPPVKTQKPKALKPKAIIARKAAAASNDSGVLDRLWETIMSRRNADPEISHSARLLSRGTAKIAQKFGEEAVECLIEAVSGQSHAALVAESADVLYHLLVLWVDSDVRPDEVWTELQRREGISGVVEKASRLRALRVSHDILTTKIP
ncbi:phosphoribosyl-ATP diphosphatase [Acidisoma cladoniae]|jgi:phosphoribosyl-ATP pyrophosphohydrolase|uniref:phosphoribosyl-ATP diphosphatase n=1 Tax=Acidisoma cladoniae TaxID=3040935 RepID=UPI00254E8726|nr:phosphoribosyl-ATP diphosphatase [Acidisoma sp. PAMC 29798]